MTYTGAVNRQMFPKAPESLQTKVKILQKLYFSLSCQLIHSSSYSLPALKMKLIATALSIFVMAAFVSVTTQSPVPQNIPVQVPSSSIISSGLGSLPQLAAQAPSLPSYVLAAMKGIQMPFGF